MENSRLRSFWTRSAILGALPLCAACNLFNPSGEGDAGQSSAASLTEGENLFRRQDYGGAMDAYDRAIREDSSSSLAYYGYAKSALRYYRINASSLLNQATAAGDTAIPFIDQPDSMLTRYLQAASRVRRALGMLTDRDTLTRWYGYLLDSNSTAAARDPLRPARIAFMRDYFRQADLGASGFRPENRFPLSDLALAYEKILADLGFVELLYTLCHLRDLDQNDTIDARDNLLKNLNFSLDSGFKVENLPSIADSLVTPENRDNVNHLIQNLADGLNFAGSVIDLLAPALGSSGTDSLSNQSLTNTVMQNLDSVIQSLGGAVTFYQFGDGLDNDGDGCADEEILDGKDNDGDGFTDEDARVIPVDLLDNDRNGVQDLADPGEDLDSLGTLRFATDSSFVKGVRYQDRDFRIHVQADSLGVRTSLTAAQRALLDSAKTLIGGCWRNYP